VPILVPPAAGEALLIYVAATTQVLSAAIVVERREEGHALPVQRPVYFISEVLSELNHIARRYNETADKLAKIASGRTTVPPDVFSRDLHQPSIKIDDTPEPEAPSAQPEVPLAQSEASSTRPEAPSARPEPPSVQPEAPSAPEGEALRVEEERSGVTPNQNW
jgi:hypothetical protein